MDITVSTSLEFHLAISGHYDPTQNYLFEFLFPFGGKNLANKKSFKFGLRGFRKIKKEAATIFLKLFSLKSLGLENKILKIKYLSTLLMIQKIGAFCQWWTKIFW